MTEVEWQQKVAILTRAGIKVSVMEEARHMQSMFGGSVYTWRDRLRRAKRDERKKVEAAATVSASRAQMQERSRGR